MCLERVQEKSQNKERLGQERSLEARRTCLGPGDSEDGNSLPLGSRLICLLAREGSCQTWEIYNVTFQPWSLWNKQAKAHSTQCHPVLLYWAPDPSHHNDKWGRIETQGGAGDAGPWGKKKVVGRTPDPRRGQGCTALPRPKDLEKSPPYQNYSAGQTRPARSQLGISVPTPRSSPTKKKTAKQDGTRQVLQGVQSSAHKRRELWGDFRLLASQFRLVCLECAVSVGKN